MYLKFILVVTAALFSATSFAFTYLPFDNNWKFYLGDVGNDPKEAHFDDSKWRILDLPHDWSIEGNYQQTANGTDWQSGYLPAGTGWYRKSFNYDANFENKKVQIQFDGIYLNSEVWINGTLLGNRPNGYIGFVYDLTPYLKKGNNVIAVKVNHNKPLTGRWYTGSGIYRHVYLLVSDFTHIKTSGIYFTIQLDAAAEAQYNVAIEIDNGKKMPYQVKCFLKDKTGKAVSHLSKNIDANGSERISLKGRLNKPHLWSPDDPCIYTLVCQLIRNDKIIDEERIAVGFRKLTFNATNGFLLNDKNLKLKGVCDHHTAGAVGAAVPDDILYYRLKLLKQMGCNAIRTAHNPFSPVFYNMCDTLGLLVLNESLDGWETPKAKDDYGNYFEQWWKKDLTDFIKRDRNHPCVFMWSIGNEVRGATAATQKKLLNLFHELDPARPVTQGGVDPTRDMKADYKKSFISLDVIGFNGNGEEIGEYEKLRKEFPDLMAIATEVPHTYQTRGVYSTKTQWRRRDFPAPWELSNPIPWKDFEKRVFPIPDLSMEERFPEEAKRTYYQSSYDNASVRISARESWKRTMSFPWLMGEFRWGSFDYLGEAVWPQRCGNFGIIDIAAIPKDHYYLCQSLWARKPMVHILPHWTHTGKEGVEIPVVVYTNCDAIELYLNGKSLGRKNYKGEQLVWQVPYKPGILTAKGYRKNKVIVSEAMKTSDQPYSFSFQTNKSVIKDKSEVIRVELDIVDHKNIMVPYASNKINFKTSGPLKIVAVDNGDPVDPVDYKAKHCKAFRGKCVVLVKPTGGKGIGVLEVSSEGLQKKVINFSIK